MFDLTDSVRIYKRTTPCNDVTAHKGAVTTDKKIVFVTFGAGKKFRRQAYSLAREAMRTNWFSKIVCLTDNSDDEIVCEFKERYYDFVRENVRGYGFWLWKPFIIKRLMERYRDGEFILYADAGCEISARGGARLRNYVDMAKEKGALLFEIPFVERAWTKRELFDFKPFAKVNRNTWQIEATWMLFAINDRGKELVDRWFDYSTRDDCRYLNETTAEHSDGYIEHRHDQSVLSMTAKSMGFTPIPWEDRFAGRLYVPNSWVFLYPIHAMRSTRNRFVNIISRISSLKSCQRNAVRPTVFFSFATTAFDRLLGLRRWLTSNFR